MTLHLKYCPHKMYFTRRVLKLFLDLQTSFSTGNRPTYSNLEPMIQPIVSPFFLCTIRRRLTIVAGGKQKDSQPHYLHTTSLVFFTHKVCFILNIGHQIIQSISSVVSHFWDILQSLSSFSRVPGLTGRTVWTFTVAIHCQDLQMLSTMKERAGSVILEIRDI